MASENTKYTFRFLSLLSSTKLLVRDPQSRGDLQHKHKFSLII